MDDNNLCAKLDVMMSCQIWPADCTGKKAVSTKYVFIFRKGETLKDFRQICVLIQVSGT